MKKVFCLLSIFTFMMFAFSYGEVTNVNNDTQTGYQIEQNFTSDVVTDFADLFILEVQSSGFELTIENEFTEKVIIITNRLFLNIYVGETERVIIMNKILLDNQDELKEGIFNQHKGKINGNHYLIKSYC